MTPEPEKVTGTFCAKHPSGLSGKRCLSPFPADLRRELRMLAGQLREAFALRSELARREILEDLRRARRLAIVGGLAGVLILAAFPLPAVAAAELLAGWGGIAGWGWLLIFAGGLFLVALAAIALAWRRFRGRLALLRQTLEELREDFLWLQEWCGKKEETEEKPNKITSPTKNG